MPASRIGTRLTPARCLGALAGLSTVSLAGTAAAPVLLDRPLALVALSPRLPFLVLAVGHVPPAVLIAVAAARHCAGDLFHFQLGRTGTSTRAASWLREHRLARHHRVRRARERLQRHRTATRHGILVAVLVRPVGRHLAIAGAAGTCPRRVAIADLAGTLAYVVGVIVAAGALR